MRAVAVPAAGRLAVVEVSEPERRPRQALVAVQSTGLCGTDVKILEGQIPVAYPRVLGHEVVGRVVEPGGDGRVPVGTRVLVNPTSWCGACRDCLDDASHLCPNGALMGRDVDGGLAELVAVDELQLHPLPDHVDDRAASLLQVLGTCLHAQTMVDVFPGQTAVVLGLGVSGLLQLQLLRARGIDRVIGVTRSPEKREHAEALGAWATAHPDDAQELVHARTDGRGADLVVESAGVPATLRQAIELAGPRARVLLFGINARADDLPLYQLYFKELDVVSARAARSRDYARAVDLAASGRLDLAPLWSHGFSIEQAEQAFEAVRQPGALKVTLGIG